MNSMNNLTAGLITLGSLGIFGVGMIILIIIVSGRNMRR